MDRRSRHLHPTADSTRLAVVLPFRASRRPQGPSDDETPDPDFVEGLRMLWADLSTLDGSRQRHSGVVSHPVGQPATVISLAERRARRAVQPATVEAPLDPCG